MKKIYVGNLPFDTDRAELVEFYTQWGEVKDVYVPMDAATGSARGFAFVTMDEGNADKAIAESNGMLYRGRKLAVSEPLPPGEKIQRPARQARTYYISVS
jgi:RNA recognition motif-containing protein